MRRTLRKIILATHQIHHSCSSLFYTIATLRGVTEHDIYIGIIFRLPLTTVRKTGTNYNVNH